MHLGDVAVPIEGCTQGHLQQQEPAIEPAVEGVLEHVTGEAVHLLQGGDVVQHPFAVGPPQAPGGVVVVVRLIGILVVVTVQTHPFDRTALAGQRAHQHQHALDPFRGHEAAVGHQPVQAEGHAQHGDPVENPQDDQGLPAPELWQQGKDRAHVHHQHETGGAELVLALAGGQWCPRNHQGGTHASLLGSRQAGSSAGNLNAGRFARLEGAGRRRGIRG